MVDGNEGIKSPRQGENFDAIRVRWILHSLVKSTSHVRLMRYRITAAFSAFMNGDVPDAETMAPDSRPIRVRVQW